MTLQEIISYLLFCWESQ